MATSEKHRERHYESKNSVVDEDDSRYECCICYKEAVNPVVLSCGHFYCWECIDKWLNNYAHGEKQCPICRTRVRDDGIIPIYGKGIVSHCENPRPSAPVQKCEKDDDESQSPTENIDWPIFLKFGIVVTGLIGAFLLGRRTVKRARKK